MFAHACLGQGGLDNAGAQKAWWGAALSHDRAEAQCNVLINFVTTGGR
jgi:hypothetical protein